MLPSRRNKGLRNNKVTTGYVTSETSHVVLAVQTPVLKVLICRSSGVAEAINMGGRAPGRRSYAKGR